MIGLKVDEENIDFQHLAKLKQKHGVLLQPIKYIKKYKNYLNYTKNLWLSQLLNFCQSQTDAETFSQFCQLQSNQNQQFDFKQFYYLNYDLCQKYIASFELHYYIDITKNIKFRQMFLSSQSLQNNIPEWCFQYDIAINMFLLIKRMFLIKDHLQKVWLFKMLPQDLNVFQRDSYYNFMHNYVRFTVKIIIQALIETNTNPMIVLYFYQSFRLYISELLDVKLVEDIQKYLMQHNLLTRINNLLSSLILSTSQTTIFQLRQVIDQLKFYFLKLIKLFSYTFTGLNVLFKYQLADDDYELVNQSHLRIFNAIFMDQTSINKLIEQKVKQNEILKFPIFQMGFVTLLKEKQKPIEIKDSNINLQENVDLEIQKEHQRLQEILTGGLNEQSKDNNKELDVKNAPQEDSQQFIQQQSQSQSQSLSIFQIPSFEELDDNFSNESQESNQNDSDKIFNSQELKDSLSLDMKLLQLSDNDSFQKINLGSQQESKEISFEEKEIFKIQENKKSLNQINQCQQDQKSNEIIANNDSFDEKEFELTEMSSLVEELNKIVKDKQLQSYMQNQEDYFINKL